MFVEKDEIKILEDNEILKLRKKESKKLFTNKERNIIINKDYNPLKVNYKIYKRGSGLFMMKNKELKEIKKGLNWKDKIFINIFPKVFIKIYKKGIEKGFNSRM